MSHETIYQPLFVQGRGELRRELARCLRPGRTTRGNQGCIEDRGRIPGMVMLTDRPAEADDRAVPGHWEGDLIPGAGCRSAVGTLVERNTRYVRLHLGDNKEAVNVEKAMRRVSRPCRPSCVAASPGTKAPRCRPTRGSRLGPGLVNSGGRRNTARVSLLLFHVAVS